MDDTQTTLLVAERDEPLREFLVGQFQADRFAAHGAQCADEARASLPCRAGSRASTSVVARAAPAGDRCPLDAPGCLER
jgi:hypothetical protein